MGRAPTPYQRQAGAGTPVGLSYASPGDFGAGVGAAIGALGDSLAEGDLRATRLERQLNANRERTEAAVDFQMRMLELDQRITDLRASPAAGAAGHTEKVQALFDKSMEGLTDTLGEDADRAEWQAKIEERRTAVLGKEYEWQSVRANLSTVDNLKTLELGDVGAIRNAKDPNAALTTAMRDFGDVVAMTSFGDDQKAAVLREGAAARYFAYGLALTDRDPKALIGALDAGGFNGKLDDTQQEQLRGRAETEIRKQEIAVEREQAKAVAAQKEAEATMLGDVGRGVAVDPGQLASAAAQAEARGDTSRAAELRAAATQSQVNTIYGNGNATPSQMSSRIAQIDGTKDWQKSPKLVAERAQLETLRGQARDAEPELPPLDFNNRAAIDARVRDQAVWAQQHNGRKLVLGKDQAAELAERAQSGPAGRLEVAELLRRLPGQWGIAALDQVAPKDPVMRQALDLPPGLRKELFAGEIAADQNKAYAPAKDFADRWGETGNLALQGQAPQWVAGVQASIGAIYAARAAKKNLQDFDQQLYDQVAGEVLNANGVGGIGRWKGRALLLPKGMSSRQVEDRIYAMREDFGAKYADGSPLSKSDLLSRFKPVAIDRDGVYRWIDDRGRFAMARDPGSGRLGLLEIDVRQPVQRRAPKPAGAQSPMYRAPPAPVKLPQGPAYRAPPTPVKK